jgi:hypothetical protein
MLTASSTGAMRDSLPITACSADAVSTTRLYRRDISVRFRALGA